MLLKHYMNLEWSVNNVCADIAFTFGKIQDLNNVEKIWKKSVFIKDCAEHIHNGSSALIRMNEDSAKEDHPTLLSEKGSCGMSVEGPFILNML